MIARDVCQRVLQVAVSTGADYAEIFAENSVNNSISMIANQVLYWIHLFILKVNTIIGMVYMKHRL